MAPDLKNKHRFVAEAITEACLFSMRNKNGEDWKVNRKTDSPVKDSTTSVQDLRATWNVHRDLLLSCPALDSVNVSATGEQKFNNFPRSIEIDKTVKPTRNLLSCASPAESPVNLICGDDPRCCRIKKANSLVKY